MDNEPIVHTSLVFNFVYYRSFIYKRVKIKACRRICSLDAKKWSHDLFPRRVTNYNIRFVRRYEKNMSLENSLTVIAETFEF